MSIEDLPGGLSVEIDFEPDPSQELQPECGRKDSPPIGLNDNSNNNIENYKTRNEDNNHSI